MATLRDVMQIRSTEALLLHKYDIRTKPLQMELFVHVLRLEVSLYLRVAFTLTLETIFFFLSERNTTLYLFPPVVAASTPENSWLIDVWVHIQTYRPTLDGETDLFGVSAWPAYYCPSLLSCMFVSCSDNVSTVVGLSVSQQISQ